jgi:glycosyltransferase involved in cell wall biosynthesis
MDKRSPPAISLSVVIITFNEEGNIGRCLASVASVADEIVVLDAGSSDATRSISRAYGARVYQQRFRGYGEQKNAAVAMAAYDHILSLDADEALTAELARSVRTAKERWAGDAFSFNRMSCFCGKWVRHGEWYPDRVVRLFDRRKARWSGGLHERLQFESRPRITFLKGRLLHYSYRSVFHYLRKTQLYSGMAAAPLAEKGLRPGPYHFYFKPLYRFFRCYVLKRGFLDGRTGYVIARLTAGRLFLQFVKVKRLQQQNKQRWEG